MFGKKSLNSKEVDKALEKIRQRYDHLITSYMKPLSLKNEFEDRYGQAMRNRMNMEMFIKMEIEMLEEFFKKEEEIQDREEQANQLRQKRIDKYGQGGYSQKVVEDLEKQIEKYPPLKIHPHAANEIMRLYGALKAFEVEFWHPLESYLINAFPAERNGALAQMDQLLWRCTHCRHGKVPTALERYVMMLDSSELYGDLLQENQSCIKEAAFLLHDIKQAIELSWEMEYEDERVRFAHQMVLAILEDFRLKDIKKKKGDQLWRK